MHKEKSSTNVLVRKMRKRVEDNNEKRVENKFFTSVEKALRNKEHKQ